MKLKHIAVLTAAGMAALTSCKKETAASGAATSTGGAQAQKILRFSAIPNQNSTELKAKFDPMAAHLTKVLGVPVEFVPSADYKASVEAFKNGQIQFAWFGGVTGVQARAAVAGARAIVQGKEDTAYKSYFVAHKDAGLEKSDAFPAAIAGLKFSFGSETSTSGRVMPSFFITQSSGKKEAEFFSTPPVFSGGHDKTLALVGAGEVQAGVCDFAIYDKLVGEKKVDPAVVKVIWETPTFADYNFTAHPDIEKDFGAGFTDKLKAALIAMTTDAPDLLKVFPRTALIEAKNEDYAKVEEVCRQTGLIR
jgi:phosphonate transport system substrate-binding protein